MVVERIALMLAILAFQRQLFSGRGIVETEIDVATATTAHNIANLGQVTVSRHSAIFSQGFRFNAIGDSKADKHQRKQSGLQYKLHG